MKKLIVLFVVLFGVTLASAEEVVEKRIVALFVVNDTIKAQFYNPSDNPMKVKFTQDGVEYEFMWEEMKPIEEPVEDPAVTE